MIGTFVPIAHRATNRHLFVQAAYVLEECEMECFLS
jgi:hypothetical protein